MLKTIGIILAASAVCTVALSMMTETYGIASPQQGGQSIGAGLAMFAVGAVVAMAVRFARRQPNAGVFSGVAATIAYSALVYVGSTA